MTEKELKHYKEMSRKKGENIKRRESVSEKRNDIMIPTEETVKYRTNEASFNYNGVTVNINIPKVLDGIKSFKQKRMQQKALKELKEGQDRFHREMERHNEFDPNEDIIYTDEEDNEDWMK